MKVWKVLSEAAVAAASSTGIAMFFVSQEEKTKWVYGLVIFAVWLISLVVRLLIENRKLDSDFSETSKKHKALAAQYDEKAVILRNCKAVFDNMNLYFAIALVESDQSKLENIYRAYLNLTSSLDLGGQDD